jgi:hypothetical protein
MLNLFKKTLAVCLIGFGLRCITCNTTSVFGLVIYNWNFNSNSRNSLAFLLKIIKEMVENDYSSKKGS